MAHLLPSVPSHHSYELRITTARLLDWYGGAHDISPSDYFAAEPVGAELPVDKPTSFA